MRAESNCGCFGDVRVPPLATALFDVFALIALILTNRNTKNLPEQLCSTGHFSAAMAIVSMASAILWISYCVAVVQAAHGMSSLANGVGDLTVIDPATWKNRPFILIDETDTGNSLRTGRWLILVYHFDCSTCIRAIDEYRKLIARESNTRSPSVRFAFIAMPPFAKPGEDPLPESGKYVRLRMRPEHVWLATTPVAVALEDGRVLTVAEGDDAIHPLSVSQWSE